jgi:hypothetical protein
MMLTVESKPFHVTPYQLARTEHPPDYCEACNAGGDCDYFADLVKLWIDFLERSQDQPLIPTHNITLKFGTTIFEQLSIE